MQLKPAALLFTSGFLLHNADHARRGLDAITEHVIWAGTAVAVVAGVVLTLVFTNHSLAPAAAAAAGLGIAVGVSASHLLPEWSAFSDELAAADVGAATWIAVFAEIVGALLLGGAGVRQLQREGSSSEARLASP